MIPLDLSAPAHLLDKTLFQHKKKTALWSAKGSSTPITPDVSSSSAVTTAACLTTPPHTFSKLSESYLESTSQIVERRVFEIHKIWEVMHDRFGVAVEASVDVRNRQCRIRLTIFPARLYYKSREPVVELLDTGFNQYILGTLLLAGSVSVVSPLLKHLQRPVSCFSCIRRDVSFADLRH